MDRLKMSWMYIELETVKEKHIRPPVFTEFIVLKVCCFRKTMNATKKQRWSLNIYMFLYIAQYVALLT